MPFTCYFAPAIVTATIQDPMVSRIELRVRFVETDLMGIVHHASYLAYFEAARVEWLRRRGITYAEWAARGVHLPVVECSLRYRGPARFDDLLDIQVRLAELRTHSLRFEYKIYRLGEPKLLTEGTTRLACIDAQHQLSRIPPEMTGILRGGETVRPPAS